MLFFEFNPNKVKSPSNGTEGIKELELDRVECVIDNKDNQWRLFPDGYAVITTAWIPIKVHEDNYEIMKKEVKRVICSVDDMSSSDTDIMKSISFGDAVQIPKGLRYVVSYNGGEEEDCLQHVYQHVKNADRFYKRGTYTLCLLLPPGIDSDIIKEELVNRCNLQHTLERPCCFFRALACDMLALPSKI